MLKNRWMYRGKPVDSALSKEWVYGSLLVRGKEENERYYILEEDGTETKVLVFSIQQATGYYDNNLNLIFEGDILQDEEEFCLVSWDEDEGGFCGYFGIDEIKKVPLGKLLHTFDEDAAKYMGDYVVVGNDEDGLDEKKCGWTDFEILIDEDGFWNGGSMVKVGGNWYLLDGWNGEKYGNCWQYRDSKGFERKGHDIYTLTPVQIPDEFDLDEPMSWMVIGYDVMRN